MRTTPKLRVYPSAAVSSHSRSTVDLYTPTKRLYARQGIYAVTDSEHGVYRKERVYLHEYVVCDTGYNCRSFVFVLFSLADLGP